MRINKFISSAGVCSRRKADELIMNGVVELNGKIVSNLGIDVDEKKDIVKVEGKVIALPLSHIYLKLFKPKGYVCSAHDEHGRKTIYDLISTDRRLFSVGRLDYDTEGLILLTDDGDFAKLVSHPSGNIEKEYLVSVEGQMKESEFAVMRKGVVENGKRMPSARVKPVSFDGKITKISVVIDEGQNRQVRRMFEAIGREIKLLKRVCIGEIRLGGLKRGESRNLRADELEWLSRLK